MFEIVQGDKSENNPGREKYKSGKVKKGFWERDEGMNGMVETTDFRRIKPVDQNKEIRSCKFDIDLGLSSTIATPNAIQSHGAIKCAGASNLV